MESIWNNILVKVTACIGLWDILVYAIYMRMLLLFAEMCNSVQLRMEHLQNDLTLIRIAQEGIITCFDP